MAWHRSRQYTTTKAKEVAKELSLTIQAACWLWPAPGGRTLRLESCVAVILMDFADATPRNNPASAFHSWQILAQFACFCEFVERLGKSRRMTSATFIPARDVEE
jgi:hypothetical protein